MKEFKMPLNDALKGTNVIGVKQTVHQSNIVLEKRFLRDILLKEQGFPERDMSCLLQ
jgi:hypothetical protein